MTGWALPFTNRCRVGVMLVLALFLILTGRAEAQSPKLSDTSNLSPLSWQLYDLSSAHTYDPKAPYSLLAFKKIEHISLVGGHYLYAGEVNIAKDGTYVIDFQNTSTIDRFTFYLYDATGALYAQASGGIGSDASSPFFLRNGRTFALKQGVYSIRAEFSSPYFIAQPVPYITTLATYQNEIKPGNALVLVGLGIFLAMGIYYGALSFARSRNTEILYALFIFSNLLFNASAHLILSQIFNVHNFYLTSVPILISNFVYVLFVMKLLEIHRRTNKKLHRFGVASLVVIVGFAIFAMISPNWINEMARYGVWVFLLFGLVAGVWRSWQGNTVARLYLVALFTFIALASMATLPMSLSSRTFYVEHYGLAAIAMEIILLALVLTYQMGLLYRERIKMLTRLDLSNKMALTDAVTQIPNLHALELELENFGPDGCLTYIDMDNLKYYNDQYGHAKGDQLLQLFSMLMKKAMEGKGFIYRVGGDEFAVTCREPHAASVNKLLRDVIIEMRVSGFEEAGVSAGQAKMHEVTSISDLKHLADMRMYQVKKARKKAKAS